MTLGLDAPTVLELPDPSYGSMQPGGFVPVIDMLTASVLQQPDAHEIMTSMETRPTEVLHLLQSSGMINSPNVTVNPHIGNGSPAPAPAPAPNGGSPAPGPTPTDGGGGSPAPGTGSLDAAVASSQGSTSGSGGSTSTATTTDDDWGDDDWGDDDWGWW